jgi:hypothetical protein
MASTTLVNGMFAAGVGGIFWQELRALFQGSRDGLVIHRYLTGLCGGDVTPAMIEEVIAGPGPCREVSLADSSSTSPFFSEMTKRQ